ncbi:MAG: DUF3369 domain-containing protein [Pseudomonadota bacterium]|nr:DUF3369 domain-containing protein [Pseudomonadota bacterium]
MNDLFVFAPDSEQDAQTAKQSNDQSWRVLVVDDEPEVHKITKLVLESLTFEDQTVELSHAYSAEEAQILLQEQDSNQPFAVAFIDVVMETETAGLDLVKHIREQLDNHITRIILRTGQPGQAPEEAVIKEYDINDYKSKTELTANKLKTALYASLRSYRDIMTIEQHRAGLQKVLQAIANTRSETNLRSLTSQILSQIASVLDLEENAMYCTVLSKPDDKANSELQFKVLAKAGNLFEDFVEDNICIMPDEVQFLFETAYKEKRSVQNDGDYVAYIGASNGDENMLFVRKPPSLTELNIHLLDIFIDHFVKAYSALALKDEVEQSQRELVYILGEAVELRSKETGSHVKRVGEISYILACAYGLDTKQCDLIKLAAPLHDVGKVSIPDAILNKPGKHTPEERAIMETHAEAGYNMLINSNTHTLRAAAQISLEHHEHWDGNGYPQGKSGNDIFVMARIAGLADVFDALGSKRCYKDPWSLEDILNLIESLKGKQFEPKLVELLNENLDEITNLRKLYPDNY